MTFIVFTQRDTHELEAIFVDFLPSYIFFMELLKQKKEYFPDVDPKSNSLEEGR